MRKLPVGGWIGLVVVYLAIIQVLSLVLTRGIDTKYAAPTTMEETWRSLTLPVGTSLLFVLALVAVLRWWWPVFVDRLPVRRWLWAIPAIQLVCIVAGTNYSGLAEKSAGFVALLLISTLMVGLAEEMMFRGIGLT